ncbi:Txe/YoeB family addiction module toxin [Nocardia takedensis]|uniref:Txe/YoeB family addiction module toxin n=1 Tax=Nocardia takedensis TaxID=259390 RepID=UPI00030F65ED|nr:Txe/YoeB family addiction module toxin [Nocardia takedensis]
MPDRKLTFTARGWRSYSEWLARDRTVLKAVNKLIEAAVADPFAGVGKPEPLRHQLAGHWSRRISQEHRLIYYVIDTELVIVQVGGHYDG